MKKLVCLLTVIAALHACNTKSNSTKNWKEFSSDSLHFKISYPEKWELKQRGKTVCLLEPLDDSSDTYQENIVAWSEEMPLAISDSLYAKVTTAELKIRNPELDIKSLPVEKFGANKLNRFRFAIPENGKGDYEVIGYTLVSGKRGFNFACTYEANAKKNYQQIFETVLSTLALK